MNFYVVEHILLIPIALLLTKYIEKYNIWGHLKAKNEINRKRNASSILECGATKNEILKKG